MEAAAFITSSYIFNKLFPNKYPNIKRLLNNTSLLRTSYYLIISDDLTQSMNEYIWLLLASSSISYICSYTGTTLGLSPVLYSINIYNKIIENPRLQYRYISLIPNIISVYYTIDKLKIQLSHEKINEYTQKGKQFITDEIIGCSIGAAVAVGIYTLRRYLECYIKPPYVSV